MDKSINKITQVEFLQLCDWLRANTEQVQKQTTFVAVSRMASEALGKTISVSSVTSAIKATNLKLAEPPRKPAPPPNATTVLARELKSLLEHLGQPVSDELQHLAGN